MSTPQAPTRRKEFDDQVFELELWPTSKALEWQHTLVQLGLEPAAMLVDDTPEDASLDQAKYATLARTIAGKLERHRIDKLMQDLLSHVWLVGEHDGKETRQRVSEKGAFDSIFRGRLMLVHRIAWWVLEENFADFIVAARSFVAVLRELWQTVSRITRDGSSNENGAAEPIDVEAGPSSGSTPAEPTT